MLMNASLCDDYKNDPLCVIGKSRARLSSALLKPHTGQHQTKVWAQASRASEKPWEHQTLKYVEVY